MKQLFALGFVQIRTVIGSGITIESGTEIKIGTGVENECGIGIRIKSVTESESKARPGVRLTSIDTKDEKMHSISMLTELKTLISWASHPRERAEQRVPDQLVSINSYYLLEC
ncbi:hypothetical protein EVAR_44582_1 [Eumeta japonica]|uniref:Uncharacterized protein n=1 Tax=Eumeta variegata TaxID=151549 RepID=A0A4C1X7Y3_EUMVA|nr:hypothetical protein EVAR_44582_1 [Eumeta japonica]